MDNKLYIVPTPIGNLKDITLRALEVLKEVDIIYCEDTRNTIKLLNHYNIKNDLKSYHEHNEKLRTEEIANEIHDGLSIAIVSDAGMPGISDPGHTIIKYFIENNLDYEVLPGATASITALVSSGLDNDKFAFLGFVPREKKNIKDFYEKLDNLYMTSIIYEEKISGTCNEVYNIFQNKDNIKGEFVIVLDKAEIKEELLDIRELLLKEINNGLSKKESVKVVVSKYGLNKNEVYKISLEL